jgi:hypothetical protein
MNRRHFGKDLKLKPQGAAIGAVAIADYEDAGDDCVQPHEEIEAAAGVQGGDVTMAAPSTLGRPSTIVCMFSQGGSNETVCPIGDFTPSSFSLRHSTTAATACGGDSRGPAGRLSGGIACQHDDFLRWNV